MLKYDIQTGVKKIKTKTAIMISAITLAVSGLGMAVAVPALSHAASGNAGTDHFGPFHSTSTDNGCSGPWAQDTFDRYFTVHDNGNGTFSVRQEYKNGSFVTTGSASPGSTCPNNPHHGVVVSNGITGNMQGFLTGTVTSTTYNPAGCSTDVANCESTSGFVNAVFGGGASFTCSNGYAGCAFNFEYSSSDKSLQYHHWQDKSDPATVGEQFIGDIANS